MNPFDTPITYVEGKKDPSPLYLEEDGDTILMLNPIHG